MTSSQKKSTSKLMSSSATLPAVSTLTKTSMTIFQGSLKRQMPVLPTMTPNGSQSLSRHRLTARRSSMTTSLTSRLKKQSPIPAQPMLYPSRQTLICQQLPRARTAQFPDFQNSLKISRQQSRSCSSQMYLNRSLISVAQHLVRRKTLKRAA